jgi:hypothetical protein
MRLFELVDSDRQLLDLIKPILLRAKAEGAKTVQLQQILNDLDSEDNVDPSMLIDVLRRHRDELKNIILSANLDSIALNHGATTTMSTNADKQANKMKSTALKQAMDKLK